MFMLKIKFFFFTHIRILHFPINVEKFIFTHIRILHFHLYVLLKIKLFVYTYKENKLPHICMFPHLKLTVSIKKGKGEKKTGLYYLA